MSELNPIDIFRSEFPELQEKVYGKDLVYLDNAATSLRPRTVIKEWESMSTMYNANIHRAVHHISSLATEKYEAARRYVAEYIGAGSSSEIVFTSGTTDSINLVAFSFGETFINPGDEIIVGESEHHSNIVPWQMMCQRKAAKLRVIPVDDNGNLDLGALQDMINERTKLVAVAHISNVLGIINPIKEVCKISHMRGVPVLIDGAQGIVHCKVDVKEIGADFYVFSGHKIYAAPGTGVLYGRSEWLEKMCPYRGGGEMIESVNWDKTTYANSPQKFEAGTQNIAGIPTLIPALEMAKRLNTSEVEREESAIRDYILDEFSKRSHIRLYGVPSNIEDKINLFSFSVAGAHHEDLALILDKMGVAVRSGQMCAEPLMNRYGVTGMLRASFSPINTLGEAKYFVQALDRAIKMLV